MLPSYAEPVENPCAVFVGSKCVSSLAQILPALAKANVVYLGETHDSLEDHQNQLKINIFKTAVLTIMTYPSIR